MSEFRGLSATAKQKKVLEDLGMARMKLSDRKSNLPGRKQVHRIESGPEATRDVIALYDEGHEGRALLVKVMGGGHRLPRDRTSLREAADRAREEIARLPHRLRELEPAYPAYPVELSPGLAAEHERLRRDLEPVGG